MPVRFPAGASCAIRKGSTATGLVCPEITMAWAAYEFDIRMHRFTLKRPEVFTAKQLVGGSLDDVDFRR